MYYVVTDINKPLLIENMLIFANSPKEAVEKLGYKNVKRDYTNGGNIVVRNHNTKHNKSYVFFGEEQ